jgi:hypothetical protein
MRGGANILILNNELKDKLIFKESITSRYNVIYTDYISRDKALLTYKVKNEKQFAEMTYLSLIYKQIEDKIYYDLHTLNQYPNTVYNLTLNF